MVFSVPCQVCIFTAGKVLPGAYQQQMVLVAYSVPRMFRVCPYQRMRMCAAAMCELEMQLVSEAVAPAAGAALPPVNALRNLALKMADTEVRLRSLPCLALHARRRLTLAAALPSRQVLP